MSYQWRRKITEIMWFDYSFFRICTKSYIYLTCLLPATLSERLLDLYVYTEVFYQAKWSVIKVSVFSDQFAIQNDFYYSTNFKLETVRIRLPAHLSFEKSTNHSKCQMTSWFALLYYSKEYTKSLLKCTTDKTMSFSEREGEKKDFCPIWNCSQRKHLFVVNPCKNGSRRTTSKSILWRKSMMPTKHEFAL